jgi:hypothetical protein
MMTDDDKVVHHRVDVHAQGDRVGFEIQLPCDAAIVTGLVASVTPGPGNLPTAASKTDQAGMLTLRWNAPGDIFYQGPVWLETRFEENYAIAGLIAPDQFLTGTTGFTIDSQRIEPVEVSVPGELRTLTGYYVDILNRMGIGDEAYTVDIFLIYRRCYDH